MRSNQDRSQSQFSAKPCMVTPAGHPDADRADLPVLAAARRREPDAAAAVDARRGCTPNSAHARISASSMAPHVGDHVDRLAQLQDRVPDELAGAVPGDLPAAVDVDHRRARVADRPVQRAGPLARGVDRLVLEQQAGVRDLARHAPLVQHPLQVPGVLVRDAPRRRSRPGRKSAHCPRLQPNAAREPAAAAAGSRTGRAAGGPWQIVRRQGLYRGREETVIDEAELRRMSPARADAGCMRALAALDSPAAARASRRRRRRWSWCDRRVLRASWPRWIGVLAVTLPRFYRAGGWRGGLGRLRHRAAGGVRRHRLGGLAAPAGADHLPGRAGDAAVLRRLVRRRAGRAHQRVLAQPAVRAAGRAPAGRLAIIGARRLLRLTIGLVRHCVRAIPVRCRRCGRYPCSALTRRRTCATC